MEQIRKDWSEIKSNDSWSIFKIMSEFVEAFDRLSKIGPCVSIFGSARTSEDNKYYLLGVQIAKELGSLGYGIISGGGPGIMEAANRGAIEAKGKSIGLGIRLPQEQRNNKYITPELSFQFHYFFMRKFFLTQPAKATIMFPGGYGTLDELSEILTLKQTGRIQQPMPIVLVGKKYWSKAINFDYFVERKVIDKEDLNLFLMTDYIDQAFEFISCILKEKCLDNPALHI
jgi:uncharacterized protein (TIGR00730 family)